MLSQGRQSAGWLFGALQSAFLRLRSASLATFLCRDRSERSRDRVVDTYVTAWLALEVAALITTLALSGGPGRTGTVWVVVFSVLFGYRLVDISQAVLNTALFDPLRRAKHFVAIQRAVILGVVNLAEVIAIFTLGRFLAGQQYSPAVTDGYDAFYATVTISTLIDAGHLPVAPYAQVMAILQVALTALLLLLLLAWAVGHLPASRHGSGRPDEEQ